MLYQRPEKKNEDMMKKKINTEEKIVLKDIEKQVKPQVKTLKKKGIKSVEEKRKYERDKK